MAMAREVFPIAVGPVMTKSFFVKTKVLIKIRFQYLPDNQMSRPKVHQNRQEVVLSVLPDLLAPQ
jgi:hypothetical protein